MINNKTRTIISILFILSITQSVYALTFTNLSGKPTGTIGNANGYFDSTDIAFGTSGAKNIYAITESSTIHILEPVSWAQHTSNDYIAINSSLNTLKTAVVNNGYLYFVDGSTLKKKSTRGFSTPQSCESTDTSSGGCVITIASGVDNTLRAYNNVVYYMTGITSDNGHMALSHLDINDNTVSDFSITLPGTQTTMQSFAIKTNGSALTVYITAQSNSGTTEYFDVCTSSGCATAVTEGTGGTVPLYTSVFVTPTYVYTYAYHANGLGTTEMMRYISNGSTVAVDYITNNYAAPNRIYIGGASVIGLLNYDATTYATFNSNEAGIDSLPLSGGSGIVVYDAKTVSVANANYYNNSVIPIDINLRFGISETNHTNYATSLFWHIRVNDPLGIQITDKNIPISCVQAAPWWAQAYSNLAAWLALGTITGFYCDGSQQMLYTPTVPWKNGTYTVYLVEVLPGQSSILSYDSWNIVNQSSSDIPSINNPPPCANCGLGGGGTIGTNTALQLISVFSFIAFWGFIIWLGIVGSAIITMSKSAGGVNGIAVVVIAWLSAVFIALIGLFDPFKIYVIVLTTIIAAVMFKYGKSATMEE